MAGMAKNIAKKKIKKKIFNTVVVTNAPAILFFIVIIVIVAALGLIADYLVELFEGVLDFLGIEEYKNMDLYKLRAFFDSDPGSLRGLEDIQSPKTLVSYIDLQLSSILMGSNMMQKLEVVSTKGGSTTVEDKSHSDFTHRYKWDEMYDMIYQNEKSKLYSNRSNDYYGELGDKNTKLEEIQYAVNPMFAYSVPWQFMSAVDFVDMNFGQEDISESVAELHRLLRPLYGKEYLTNTDYANNPEYLITGERTRNIDETLIEYEWLRLDDISNSDRPTGLTKFDEDNEQIYQVIEHESSETWTEVDRLEGPGHVVGAVKFYRGTYEFDVEYKQVPYDDVTTGINEETEDYKIESSTVYSGYESVPIITGYTSKDENLDYLTDALMYTMGSISDIELFQEIVSMYPYSEHLVVAIEKAMQNSKVDIPANYGALKHNFVYPTLKKDVANEKFYRSDIVNLASSLEGLDYFWGGKYNQVGFNSTWGSLKKVTAPGVNMSFGTFRNGLDCSGFVQWVYKNAGLDISAGTYGQLYDGDFVQITEDELLPGDLGFYHTYNSGQNGNHVGIFLREEDGQHLFINAGGSRAAATSTQINGRVLVQSIEGGYNSLAPVKFVKFFRYKTKNLLD